MAIILITRHCQRHARRWAAAQGIALDYVFPRLNPRFLRPGDTVIGRLPVPLAAQVWTLGASYLHLPLDRRGGLPRDPAFTAYLVCPAQQPDPLLSSPDDDAVPW